MEKKKRIKIFDSAFTPFGKSASLREENSDIAPTHFEWVDALPNSNSPRFYTDHEGLFQPRSVQENNILWLLEPRCLRPENYKEALHQAKLFDVILTYDKELLDAVPNAKFYPLGGSSISFDKWKVYPKSKGICMFVSDKKTTEGHKLRHEIAKHFGDRIDLYGAGVGKTFDSKFEILKDYKYCVVVESCWQEWYWTEKIIDCFSVGTVPLYYGCSSIGNWFDIYGIRQLNEINHLEIFFKNSEDWDMCPSQRLIQKNMETAKMYRMCEDVIYRSHPELFT